MEAQEIDVEVAGALALQTPVAFTRAVYDRFVMRPGPRVFAGVGRLQTIVEEWGRSAKCVPAVSASDAQEAVNRNATAKVSLEFVKHEGRQLAAAFFQFRQKRCPVLLNRSVKQGRFWTMAFVRAPCWLPASSRGIPRG